MISDEMRELLSAYVDGELRHADAVRVEELSKRDPRLRREIDAYRHLREKLRDWDLAENDLGPSASMRERALGRARNYLASLRAERPALLARPAAIAAGLLVAAAAGLLASFGAGEAPPRIELAERAPAGAARPAPLPDLAAATVDVPPLALPRWQHGTLTVAEAIDRFGGGWIDRDTGAVMSARALDLLDELRQIEGYYERQRATHVKVEERTTLEPIHAATHRLTGPYAAMRAPVASLVLLSHAARTATPPASPLPVGEGIGLDHSQDADRIGLETNQAGPRLALLGDVWVSRDESRRTRVVRSTTWVDGFDFVPVVWADRTPFPSRQAGRLAAAGFVLGPQARRQLLLAKSAQDPAFVRWLEKACRGRTLSEVFEEKRTERERTVGRLMRALSEDAEATGFAVLAGGKVLGFELFASHRLMLDSAPRLLEGYLIEAGPDAIEIEKAQGGGDDLVEQAERLLDRVPQRSAQLEVVTAGRDNWPEGMRAINLRDGVRRVVGHGLVIGERVIQLSLFGD